VPQRNEPVARDDRRSRALVLIDNYRQNEAISIMERMSVARLGSKQHFIRTLERKGCSTADRISAERCRVHRTQGRGLGLTRPELSVLLSYSKIVLFQQLLDSDVPEDPYLSKELRATSPSPARTLCRAHAASSPEARDHCHGGDQLDGQSHGRDLPAAHAGRHRAEFGADRQGL
jgi:glutamate dehydrogenase